MVKSRLRLSKVSSGGLPLNPRQAQVEWDACFSPRRTYTGINEVVSTDKLWRLLFGFFERVHSSPSIYDRELARQALLVAADGGPRSYYEAFLGVVNRDPDYALTWLRYAHELYPKAPKGFEWVGRMANESRKITVGESPRLLALPYPTQDVVEGALR